MTNYINQLNVKSILTDLTKFENSLKELFSDYDMDLRTNLGRRNALISSLQEKVTAKRIAISHSSGERYFSKNQ